VRVSTYGDRGTTDLVLDCGGTASFTKSFVYLGSLFHCYLSDRHDMDESVRDTENITHEIAGKTTKIPSIPNG
jgi:hypothetical protein